jgi:hypothetical protein
MEIKKLLRAVPHPGRDESRSLDKSGTYNAHLYATFCCEAALNGSLSLLLFYAWIAG